YVYEGQKWVVGFCCTGCRTKFLQGPAGYMETAVAAAKAGPPKKKDKKVSETATGPCDVKRIVKVPWCPMCNRELSKDDVLPTKVCKRCETKPVMAEFCVKMGESEDRARISYKCETCNATAELESEFKHAADCKPKL